MKCDQETGTCQIPDPSASVESKAASFNQRTTVRYVGDPMCSWCWGISPTVKALKETCNRSGIDFAITVGGLRAGGGDAWTADFRHFLQTEWQHIARATGQPFGLSLLKLPHFDYDTEPACRATVAVQMLFDQAALPSDLTLEFFSAIQQKFYVEGDDPKTVGFYESICSSLGIDFASFKNAYQSAAAGKHTSQEFSRCRRLGVRAFPTLLLEHDGDVSTLGVGHVTLADLVARIARQTGRAITEHAPL